MAPGLSNPLLAPSAYLDPLQRFKGQTTGVDLDFRVGIATDSKGDIRLGLAFSRVAGHRGLPGDAKLIAKQYQRSNGIPRSPVGCNAALYGGTQ